MSSTKGSSPGQRNGVAVHAILAAILIPALAACANGVGLQSQADEQTARAAREKLWQDEQSGNTAAIEADSHAYREAQAALFRDRGVIPPGERIYYDGHRAHK